MEDLYRAIVGGGGEEGISGMEVDRAYRPCVIPSARVLLADGHIVLSASDVLEDFIRLVTEVKIEPGEFPVVTSNYQVIPRWMYVHARDPAHSRLERLEQFLPRQIVQADISLCLRNKIWVRYL